MNVPSASAMAGGLWRSQLCQPSGGGDAKRGISSRTGKTVRRKSVVPTALKRRRRDAPAGIRAGTSSTSKPAAGSSRGPLRMFARILASEFIPDIKATSARCIMLTHTHTYARKWAGIRTVYVVVRAPIGANGPTRCDAAPRRFVCRCLEYQP